MRVNDRGPFAESARIIDLSRGAADLLGNRAKGKAPVRVRVVEPSERDRKALRDGKRAAKLAPVSERTLASLRHQFVSGAAPF